MRAGRMGRHDALPCIATHLLVCSKAPASCYTQRSLSLSSHPARLFDQISTTSIFGACFGAGGSRDPSPSGKGKSVTERGFSIFFLGMGECDLACILALAVLCGVVDGGDGDVHYSGNDGRKSVSVLVMAMESEVHNLGWLSDCLSSRLPAAETRLRFHVSTVRSFVGQPQAAEKLTMLPASPPCFPTLALVLLLDFCVCRAWDLTRLCGTNQSRRWRNKSCDENARRMLPTRLPLFASKILETIAK